MNLNLKRPYTTFTPGVSKGSADGLWHALNGWETEYFEKNKIPTTDNNPPEFPNTPEGSKARKLWHEKHAAKVKAIEELKVAQKSLWEKYKESCELFRVNLLVKYSKAIHLFIREKAFAEWLVQCSPIIEWECCQVIQQQFLTENAPCGVLHFPCGCGLDSSAFTIADKQLKIAFSSGSKSYNEINQGTFIENGNKSPAGEGVLAWHGRLISGLGMYVNCFPETVFINMKYLR